MPSDISLVLPLVAPAGARLCAEQTCPKPHLQPAAVREAGGLCTYLWVLRAKLSPWLAAAWMPEVKLDDRLP